jgi:hypothetical protein
MIRSGCRLSLAPKPLIVWTSTFTLLVLPRTKKLCAVVSKNQDSQLSVLDFPRAPDSTRLLVGALPCRMTRQRGALIRYHPSRRLVRAASRRARAFD